MSRMDNGEIIIYLPLSGWEWWKPTSSSHFFLSLSSIWGINCCWSALILWKFMTKQEFADQTVVMHLQMGQSSMMRSLDFFIWTIQLFYWRGLLRHRYTLNFMYGTYRHISATRSYYGYDLVAGMDFAQCNKVVSFYRGPGWTRKTYGRRYNAVALNCFNVCKFMHHCT